MAELDRYHTFVGYNAWANRRAAAMLAGLSAEHVPRPLLLFSHLLRAEAVWLGRIQGSSDAALALWETDSLTVCRKRVEANTGLFATVLAVEPTALDCAVLYTNTQGTPYSTPLAGILEHVFNHSTHHRAQLSLLVREAGGVPQPLDLIVYFRLG